MFAFTSSIFERFREEAEERLGDERFTIPDEFFESEYYKKWGLGPKREFSTLEKYWMMQLPMIVQTWEKYQSIDLEKLTREEKRFLDDMRDKHGKGPINFRQETRKEKDKLGQHQVDWFDLIKACTGADELDNKGLVFLHRMTP